MRVVKFGQNGQITLAEPQQASDLKRRDAAPNDEDPFKYFAPTCGGLKKARARQIRIDELGRVLDPGFPARTARRRARGEGRGGGRGGRHPRGRAGGGGRGGESG